MKNIAIIVTLLAFAGCGKNGKGEEQLPTTCENTEFEATFVVDSLVIPDQNVGYNLDGENTHCESGCINDGEGGVDNRLGAVLDGISESMGEDFNANAELATQIEEGSLLILFRLLDICNFNADGAVDLMGYIGYDTDVPEDPTDNFSGIEPFDVDIRALEDPGTDIDAPLISFPGGEIDRRQFSAGPSDFTLDIPIQDSVLSLVVRETQMRFRFSPEPEDTGGKYLNGNIIEGLLGGFVMVEDLSVALQEFASELGDIDPETVEQIIINQADIDIIPEGPTGRSCTDDPDCAPSQECGTGGICMERPGMMDALSLAIQFSGTSADFTGTIITCGDGIIEGIADGFEVDEVCDGDDLDDESCTTLGHTGGELSCMDDCTGFDETACTG